LDALIDGKNEESTSEDTYSYYAMKLWGHVIGDSAMEMRANLQLAILRRGLKSYFLYEEENQHLPRKFVGNKNAGIVRLICLVD
jgi:endo-1,3(4)-beta-glucanase